MKIKRQNIDRKELNDDINEEGDKLKELEILQNKLDEMEATDNDNFTIDIQKDKRDAKKALHEKMKEVAKEKNIKLKYEDMPEVVVELFMSRTLERTIEGINNSEEER